MKSSGQRPPRRMPSPSRAELERVIRNTINQTWIDPEKEKKAAALAQKAGFEAAPDVHTLTRRESCSVEIWRARGEMEFKVCEAIRTFEQHSGMRVLAVELLREGTGSVCEAKTNVEMPRAGE